MKFFRERLEIKHSRWPWQNGYNWRGMTSSSAPLNLGAARFGGGWRYKIGLDIGGIEKKGSVTINLLFGIVSIRWDLKKRKKNETI